MEVLQRDAIRLGKGRLVEALLVITLLLFLIASTVLIVLSGFRLANCPDEFEEEIELLPTANSLRWGRHAHKVARSANRTKICLTPSCVHAASKILEKLDANVDPCENFYLFTCGRFLNETIIPDDRTHVTAMSTMADKVKEQIRSLLEEPLLTDEPKPYRLAKNLYSACVNKSNIEEQGIQPILDVLKRLGGWPVLDGKEWNEDAYNWTESVFTFRDVGFSVDYFLDFSVLVDLKNSSKRTIRVGQATLSLGREYLTKSFDYKNKTLLAYYQYQVNVATALGANATLASKEMKEATLFEMKLANISLPNEQRRNASKLFHPMTIQELQNHFPSIPWLNYFNHLIGPGIILEASERVNVDSLSYIKQLESLLEETPKRVQANYLLWRAVSSVISSTTEAVRSAELKYSGKHEREPKWRECVDVVNNRLHHAVGSLYVQNFFQEDAKKNSQEIVDNIKAESLKIINKLGWMDDETRGKALEKAQTMTSWMAYPDELLNISLLEQYYRDLEVDPEFYLQSMLNVTLFETEKSFSRLREPVVKNEWTERLSSVVNAFYSKTDNSIHFPAGILQTPFFASDRPRYLNYGAIGFVIGHEITHGFDDQGRQFDKNGHLLDWWAKNTEKKFLKKAQCIIEQYGNYTVQEVGLKINGVNTQGENMADNGGIKMAYRAYQEWVKRNSEEPTLPGLSYSPRQLFWLSAAGIWCAKHRPEALRLKVVTDTHAAKMYRVIGSFSNMDDFAKDFKCHVGSKMNPAKKCVVW